MGCRAVLIAGLLAGPVLAQTESAGEAPPRPVKLMTVSAADGGLTRRFFGSVAAHTSVDLAFQVGGEVVRLPVIEGQTVPEGELLAQLDLEPFELALDQARLRRDQAQRALDRLSSLLSAAVSEVNLDDAGTELALASVALRSAESDLEHATLTAPFDALVASRDVEQFSTVSAGTPIVRIHDMSEIRIDIDVPEVLLQRAGYEPELAVSATFPASDEEFPLEVREFNAETSKSDRPSASRSGWSRPRTC